LGRPRGHVAPEYSLRPVAERLEALLGQRVELVPDCVGPEPRARAGALKPGEVLLLENLRFHAGEEANDDGFARELAALADCYVNDAFAAAHRAHASIVAITRHLQPAAAGLLMQQELSALGRILESPERPLVAILGGAKVSDKLALVEHLLERVDALLIGGGMAFTVLLALGHAVGRSLVASRPPGPRSRRRAVGASAWCSPSIRSSRSARTAPPGARSGSVRSRLRLWGSTSGRARPRASRSWYARRRPSSGTGRWACSSGPPSPPARSRSPAPWQRRRGSRSSVVETRSPRSRRPASPSGSATSRRPAAR